MNNPIISTIMNRRSIRSYKPEQITKFELDAILQCGLNAPSAHNNQSWHFTVVQNKDILKEINEEVRQIIINSGDERRAYIAKQEDYNIFYNAPTVIFVSMIKDEPFTQTNCALAIENMLLAAESQDVGSCIIGLVKLAFEGERKDYFLEKLDIARAICEPLCAVSFGYKAGLSLPKDRMQNKVTFIR